jgi:hypothetical protein
MDPLIVLLGVVASVVALDALAILFGQDSRSIADDAWARPWSSSAGLGQEC